MQRTNRGELPRLCYLVKPVIILGKFARFLGSFLSCLLPTIQYFCTSFMGVFSNAYNLTLHSVKTKHRTQSFHFKDLFIPPFSPLPFPGSHTSVNQPGISDPSVSSALGYDAVPTQGYDGTDPSVTSLPLRHRAAPLFLSGHQSSQLSTSWPPAVTIII